MRRLRQRLRYALVILATSLIIVVVVIYALLRGSLPDLDGEVIAGQLSADVTIERDDNGVPTITAGNRIDLAYATGYVHGQDRFFSMDLTRRKAAGELSEIVGSGALPLDRRSRIHRFRTRANRVLENLGEVESSILHAYASGVNDGLGNLDTKPFEYYLLQADPRPWVASDTLLVVFAMYMELNDERAEQDIGRGFAHDLLPGPAFDWLFPDGTNWDAPISGEPRRNRDIPGPDEYTLNTASAMDTGNRVWPAREEPVPGSNNWAVAGHLSDTGAAIVANDMHLGLTTPNIFYRARLRVRGDRGIDLNGVTLPGTPILVAGSNGRIAWGNTNSSGDWTDAVIVHLDHETDSYVTPMGPRPIETFSETILVKGKDAVSMDIRETIWGPINDDQPDADKSIAVSWIAHHQEAVTLGHLELEHASDVESALDIASTIGMPPQNFVVGDADGNIGWTIAGKIPRRASARLPVDWSQGGAWDGWVPAEDYPRVINPPSGRIWTANARVVDGDALAMIGDGGYVLGARAGQIRDGLFAKARFSATDMLDIQLDDRAIFLEHWQALLLETLNDAAIANHAGRAAYRQRVQDWMPRATTSSVGYRLVREFRDEVRRRALTMMLQPVLDTYGEQWLEVDGQVEGPLWSLVTRKPAHLLTDNYANWDDLLLQAVDTNIGNYTSQYADGLDHRSWGERNVAAIQHPLSFAIPALSGWLDMPADELAGDSNMPRVQFPDFGASERFAVSPGNEGAGYFHMPAGQSGHPLSDFYRKGHEDWVQGRPSSFLPGKTRHTLTLKAGH